MTRKSTETHTCPRCNGEGHLVGYSHIRNGICFKCAGSGKVAKITRRATVQRVAGETEYSKLVKIAMNDERIWKSSRMMVSKDHPYAAQHAVEVYKWHEKNGW